MKVYLGKVASECCLLKMVFSLSIKSFLLCKYSHDLFQIVKIHKKASSKVDVFIESVSTFYIHLECWDHETLFCKHEAFSNARLLCQSGNR